MVNTRDNQKDGNEATMQHNSIITTTKNTLRTKTHYETLRNNNTLRNTTEKQHTTQNEPNKDALHTLDTWRNNTHNNTGTTIRSTTTFRLQDVHHNICYTQRYNDIKHPAYFIVYYNERNINPDYDIYTYLKCINQKQNKIDKRNTIFIEYIAANKNETNDLYRYHKLNQTKPQLDMVQCIIRQKETIHYSTTTTIKRYTGTQKPFE